MTLQTPKKDKKTPYLGFFNLKILINILKIGVINGKLGVILPHYWIKEPQPWMIEPQKRKFYNLECRG